jgi:hypothetical protein
VNSADRFVALLVGLVAIGGGLGSGMVLVIRTMSRVSASWATTTGSLQELVRDVAELVRQKERDHDRIEARQNRIEQRQQDHETWHMQDRDHAGR